MIRWVIALTLSMSHPALAQTCRATSIPGIAPTTRYNLHGDGTVTDTATGLMWKQCSEGQSGADCATGSAFQFTWKAALDQAATLNNSGGFAGHADWRVPNSKELESLLEEQGNDPAINLTVFPNATNSFFWSTTSGASDTRFVWVVHFGTGYTDWDIKDNHWRVRLVRARQ